MKKINLSIIALLATSNLVMAGGDISPVTYYETNDYVASEMIYVEPAPIVVEPEVIPMVEPVVISEPIVKIVAPIKEVVPAPIKELVVIPPKPVVVPLSPVAVSGLYAGLGVVAARYDTKCKCPAPGRSGVDKTGGVMGRVGYDFNKYIGVEARGLITTIKSNGGEVKHGGVFLKPMIPVSDAINMYGLVGVGATKTTGHLRTTDVSGLAFGGGLEYDISSDKQKKGRYDREFDGKGDQEKGLGLFVDYERLYYKKNSPDLDTISVGVTYDF